MSPNEPPTASAQVKAKKVLAEATAELHLFDYTSEAFVLQDNKVTATILTAGKWKYWLGIDGWLTQAIGPELNPMFNTKFLSFMFNDFDTHGMIRSWLIRFKDDVTTQKFQQCWIQALWEQMNQAWWEKTKPNHQHYVFSAFQVTNDEDPPDAGIAEQDSDDDNDIKQSRNNSNKTQDQSKASHNLQLAIGHKHDRSFVVRNGTIEVFKHTVEHSLNFSTLIPEVKVTDGSILKPVKVMLHNEDTNMIMQNEADPHLLYRMDLECGKIVNEWKIHDDIPVKAFIPNTKFAQMSGEQTFTGLSQNALYRVDPRCPGNKSSLRQYTTKTDFSVAAATEKGYIAVASNKGDIRLFDRLGINAKTYIPALGDPIIGIDVTADGRWILATCHTYLLLIDTLHAEGKHKDESGFERSFSGSSKPRPHRLALNPKHIALIQYESDTPLSFTRAYFDMGQDLETSIVSATGPFVVTWKIGKVLANKTQSYTIKRCSEEVKADNFAYGTDQHIIVASERNIEMVPIESFRRATKKSICI